MDDFSIELPLSNSYWSDDGIIFVGKESDSDLRRKLQTFAYYFKREFKYDFTQYREDEHLRSDKKCEGFLFSEFAIDRLEEDQPDPYRLCGGGCFRWREREAGEPKWELDWVWLHPFFRHRNLFSSQWALFKDRFGDFGIAQPISADMERFLKKHSK